MKIKIISPTSDPLNSIHTSAGGWWTLVKNPCLMDEAQAELVAAQENLDRAMGIPPSTRGYEKRHTVRKKHVIFGEIQAVSITNNQYCIILFLSLKTYDFVSFYLLYICGWANERLSIDSPWPVGGISFGTTVILSSVVFTKLFKGLYSGNLDSSSGFWDYLPFVPRHIFIHLYIYFINTSWTPTICQALG